ncbi:MAG TPA: cupin domain-containing protein [Bdellovibrionota bacterium]|nr:cupin domain-containing protein [Bdellovibrionota bacterium]
MRRVEKPWGFELIFAETDKYVGKILHINAGEQLSLQYHKQKDETIYVAQGVLKLEISDQRNPPAIKERIMKVGEHQRITPGMVHRFSALETCELFEVSSPEIHDVIRLEDRYGRI